ncbi:MAG: serine/threonine protein kinase [Planctomycetes bacterium]|nr:serine/threonine protein kinase [Planctomycetota bacterium]
MSDADDQHNQGQTPDLDETIPVNLNGPRPSSSTDLTIPMAAPDPNATIGMVPTQLGAFNESDTAATQMAPQQQASGIAGDNCSGQIWGDFELGKKIGQGGMGAVYLGRQVSLDRPVAIKVLPPHLSQDESFRKRFELEAKAVAQITSPYIIQVYGAGEHQGQNFFAMEYVEGKDLGELIKDGLRPTYQESADFMAQAVKGLATAGEHNLVHRDIKPGNMMVTDKGHLKIMDFGLVKLKNSEGGSTGGLTMAGAVMGTVNYFSPEQGRGEECDQTTDIYAIGVVFYQLLAGTLPFTGTDATSIIYQHIHAEPRPLNEINPNVPESYQAIVSKCMQKDRRKRYQTASDLLKDLELVLEGSKPQNAPMDPDQMATGGSSVTDPKKGSHGGLIVVLILLLAAGAGYYFWDQNNKNSDGAKQSLGGQNTQSTQNNGSQQSTGNNNTQSAVNPIVKAGEMLGTGDLDNAEVLIQSFLSKEPGNQEWLNLSRRLNSLRAESAIKTARNLIQDGKLTKASILLIRAQELGGDSEEIEDLLKKIRVSSGMEEKLETVRSLLDGGNPAKATAELNALKSDTVPAVKKLRGIAEKMKNDLADAHAILANGDIDTARGIFQGSNTSYQNKAASDGLKALAPALQFKRAIDDNQLDVAHEQLKEMKLLIPGAPAIAAAEQKIKVVEVIVRGRKAARSGDMDAAQRTLAQISELIPDSAKEKSFKAYVQQYLILFEFRAAVKMTDLKLAREQLELLKKVAPDTEAHLIAIREYKESKIEESDRQQKEKAFDEEVTKQVKVIKAMIMLAQPDFEAVNKNIATLTTFAGKDVPELKEIDVLIIKKKSQIGVGVTLMAIDKAIIEGRNDELPQYIADQKFLAILESFVGKTDLIFKHSLEKFQLQNKKAQVDVILTNKFDTFPQTDMKIKYVLLEVNGFWQIQSHKLGQ